MGSPVKVRVGYCIMCIGRELSDNCLGISRSSFQEFYSFFKGMFSFSSLLINCFLWGKTSVQISSSIKKKKNKTNIWKTVILKVWVVGINFCFPPKVISGLLQAGCTAWSLPWSSSQGKPWYLVIQGCREEHTWESLVCMCATAVVLLEMTLHWWNINWSIEVKISGAAIYRKGGSRQRTPQGLFSALYFLQEKSRPEA